MKVTTTLLLLMALILSGCSDDKEPSRVDKAVDSITGKLESLVSQDPQPTAEPEKSENSTVSTEQTETAAASAPQQEPASSSEVAAVESKPVESIEPEVVSAPVKTETPTTDTDKTSPESAKQTAEPSQLTQSEQLRLMNEEQQRRFDKLLDRWEKQADRYDALLGKWENDTQSKPE